MSQVLGIDWSLSGCGLALASDQHPNHPKVIVLHSAGHRDDPLNARLERLQKLSRRVAGHVRRYDDGSPLTVVIEAPLYGAQSMGSQHDRSGGWWMTIDRICRLFGDERRGPVRVAECAPTTAKLYWTMHGNASKAQMLRAARDRFPGVTFEDDNAADALALASIGARRLGFPLEPEQSLILSSVTDHVAWWDDDQRGTP